MLIHARSSSPSLYSVTRAVCPDSLFLVCIHIFLCRSFPLVYFRIRSRLNPQHQKRFLFTLFIYFFHFGELPYNPALIGRCWPRTQCRFISIEKFFFSSIRFDCKERGSRSTQIRVVKKWRVDDAIQSKGGGRGRKIKRLLTSSWKRYRAELKAPGPLPVSDGWPQHISAHQSKAEDSFYVYILTTVILKK